MSAHLHHPLGFVYCDNPLKPRLLDADVVAIRTISSGMFTGQTIHSSPVIVPGGHTAHKTVHYLINLHRHSQHEVETLVEICKSPRSD